MAQTRMEANPLMSPMNIYFYYYLAKFSENWELLIKKGDQIGQFFDTLGYFWKLYYDVLKNEIAKINGNIFGFFLIKTISKIFI
jgi:hypothetical protein